MNKEERAIYDYMVSIYSNTGFNQYTVARSLYCLITNKIKKEDLYEYFVATTPMCGRVLTIMKEAAAEKNWILFTRKYSEALGLFEGTISAIDGDMEQHNITIEEGDKFTGKIPVKGVLWLARKLAKRTQRESYLKFALQNPRKGTPLKSYRDYFIGATQNTQERYRKKPLRYTVSYDEDKPVFYTSMEGRLAKLPYYKFKKYVKEGKIQEDGERRAKEVIPDGVFVRIGKYIEKNYSKWPMETKESLQRAFEEIKPCHMVIDRDFKKAYDPIYNDHQDTDGDKASNYSCMSGRGTSAQEFYGGIHGCSVVRFETEDGKQVGRCIVYEYQGQRHFIRIYGLYDYHRTMLNLLTNEMKSDDLFGRNECIDGMELETDWTDDTPNMYLDGENYGWTRDWRDNHEHYHIVADDYDNDGKSTSNGTIGEDEDDYYTCDNCGHRVHQDDVYYCGDYVFCSLDCAHEEGWYACDRCGEWLQERDGLWVEDDNFYCDDGCARADGCRMCEHCGEWHGRDDMLEPESGTYYCDSECAEADGWLACAHCDDWVHKDDAIEIDDNVYCCEYCAEKAGYVKIGEEWKRAEDAEEVKETEEPKEVANEG